jgi:hypothetical protein
VRRKEIREDEATEKYEGFIEMRNIEEKNRSKKGN